jgi:hypothetical protein
MIKARVAVVARVFSHAPRLCFVRCSSVVGSFIFPTDTAKDLAVCPFCRRVLWSRESSPDVYRVELVCSLDDGHCVCHGKRLKFASYGIDSLRVIWVCSRIVDLCFLRDGNIHG